MTQVSVSKAFTERRQAWLSELRASCLVLTDKPAYMVAAVSVTQRFADLTPEEREQLRLLATNLAGEYGLTAEVAENNAWLTARLVRAEEHEAETEAPRDGDDRALTKAPGLMARLRLLLRPRQVGNVCQVTTVPHGTEEVEAEEGMVVS